jgi:GTPase
MTLAERVRAGERAAVAEALNLAEDRRPEAGPRLAALLAELDGARAHRVGVTGPPGVGKSTLVAALVRALRAGGRSAGVLAVDPSSIRSGGALLGDRVRMATDPADHGVFVRSLATAGELGGLARSVPASLLVLAAAFDVAIVETVGVGQSETDVRYVADTVVFVIQPGSGDALQFLKAGIMEVPDVLVVNKADQTELARRAEAELSTALTALRAAGALEREVPLIATSATQGTGVDALLAALDANLAALAQRGQLAARRREGQIAWAMRAFVRRHGEEGVERAGGHDALHAAIAARVDAREPVPRIVSELL